MNILEYVPQNICSDGLLFRKTFVPHNPCFKLEQVFCGTKVLRNKFFAEQYEISRMKTSSLKCYDLRTLNLKTGKRARLLT